MSEVDPALAEILKSLAEGQKQLAEQIKKIGDQRDLVPIKMPDGSVQLVPRSSLTATTTGHPPQTAMKAVEHEPLTAEPWPDPSQPRPKPVR